MSSITARYLGVDTRSRCTATTKVTGTARFALVGSNLAEDPALPDGGELVGTLLAIDP